MTGGQPVRVSGWCAASTQRSVRAGLPAPPAWARGHLSRCRRSPIDRPGGAPAVPGSRDPAGLAGRVDLPGPGRPSPGHRHRRRRSAPVPLPPAVAGPPRPAKVRPRSGDRRPPAAAAASHRRRSLRYPTVARAGARPRRPARGSRTVPGRRRRVRQRRRPDLWRRHPRGGPRRHRICRHVLLPGEGRGRTRADDQTTRPSSPPCAHSSDTAGAATGCWRTATVPASGATCGPRISTTICVRPVAWT